MSLPDATVMELYDQGQSCAIIARLAGCSATTMYNRLKSLNVIMRDRSKANQLFPDFIFINLYNLGLSVSQIGRLLGVDPSTVTKRLHILKFPLRCRCVASKIRYSDDEFYQYFMVSDVIDKLMEMIDK
jgi:DNA-binding CsgD family transcriptional regulator